MLVSEFDYALPDELIAQHPSARRGDSRLLHLDPESDPLRDLRFADFASLVGPRDVLVLNDTQVIKARLFGRKQTGGQVELLVERIESAHQGLALVRASHPPRTRSTLRIDGTLPLEVLGREGEFIRLRSPDLPFADLLERHGSVPLPPYIQHAPDREDEARYQTVYAAHPGAVAAPTAGLHFDEDMLERIAQRGARLVRITLHVGAGTFQPVRVEDTDAHRMHRERYEVSPAAVAEIEAARSAGGRVLAVGTTTLRALESAARGGSLVPCTGDTDLFITPGYRFRVVDRLLTNFHLPRSTLLMLVSAFAGMAALRRAYAHAVAERYRFFSYGDAMLIERAA